MSLVDDILHMHCTKEQYEERLKICNDCEHNKLNVCSQCGCFVLAKNWLRLANCPINKWSSIAREPVVHD